MAKSNETENMTNENQAAQPDPAETQENQAPDKENQKPKAEKKPKDPWEEMVQVIVPRKPRGEDQSYYICVNDRRFQLPADGKPQIMPQPIAEVLLASIAAEAEADDYADHIPNRSGEQPQQHAIGG